VRLGDEGGVMSVAEPAAGSPDHGWRFLREIIAHAVRLTSDFTSAFVTSMISWPNAMAVDPVTNEIVWKYQENPVYNVFSSRQSNAQRLPKGNTLICEANSCAWPW
jgi:hypothetical protein